MSSSVCDNEILRGNISNKPYNTPIVLIHHDLQLQSKKEFRQLLACS